MDDDYDEEKEDIVPYMYYIGDDGQPHDEAIHDYILATGDDDAARAVSRELLIQWGLDPSLVDKPHTEIKYLRDIVPTKNGD